MKIPLFAPLEAPNGDEIYQAQAGTWVGSDAPSGDRWVEGGLDHEFNEEGGFANLPRVVIHNGQRMHARPFYQNTFF